MKKTLSVLSKVLLTIALVLMTFLLNGNIETKADTVDDSYKTVRVTSSKQLKKALDDPSVDTIIFRTFKRTSLTIKANNNAKDKLIIIDAPNASIENKALFGEIQLVSVSGYVENVSGNAIGVLRPSGIRSFKVAKKKTVEAIFYVTDSVFDQNLNCYTLRKGAKVNNVWLSTYGTESESSDYDEKNRVFSLKYTDSDGNARSYKLKLDKRGRIVSFISDATYNFDYNYKYDKNGNTTLIYGSDDDDGNITFEKSYDGLYILKEDFESDVKKYGYAYSYDDKGYKYPYKVDSYEASAEGEVAYSTYYTYDSKGRILTKIEDYGEGNFYKTVTDYNSKSFMVKETSYCCTEDGEQAGESYIVSYEYNKAGDMISKTILEGDQKYEEHYIYDEYGTLIDILYPIV